MLVPFVIDADSVAPDPAWSAAQSRACHKSLLDVWQRAGLLTHDGDRFENSRLFQAVQQLPQNLRTLWHAVLTRVPLRPCAGAWNGLVTPDSIIHIRGSAELAFVDDAHAEVEFSFPDDCDEKTVSDGKAELDICRLLAANQARAFSQALLRSGLHIEAGETYQAIWDSRFTALATAPLKTIVVVDRYAVSQHFECPQTKLSGLARFLRLLNAHASGERHLTILAAWTEQIVNKSLTDVEGELRGVLERLDIGNLRSMRVAMLPNSIFGGVAHDRFMRFDKYVWDVGIGLKIFEGPAAGERSSATFKSGDHCRGYTQAEQSLLGHSSVKTFIIRR